MKVVPRIKRSIARADADGLQRMQRDLVVTGVAQDNLNAAMQEFLANEIIHAKENWVRTLNAFPALIALLDVDHRIIHLNRAMAERLKCTTKQAAGAPCYERIHGLSAPPDYCPHKKMMASGKQESAEVWDACLGGYFIVTVTPRRNPAGQLIGSFHVAYDITERKQAEAVLREKEANFRNLAENAFSGIIISSTGGRILYANRRSVELLQYTLEELRQVSQQDLVDPAACRKLRKRLREGIAERHVPFSYETVMRRKDGTSLPVEITGTRTVWQGQVSELLYFHDITTRKKAEERIRLFSHEMLAAREGERKRVSSVLHHDVGSMAVGFVAHMNAIERSIRSGKSRGALAWLKRTRKLFRDTESRLKGLAVQLRPPELDVLGLRAALQQHFACVAEHRDIRILFRDNFGQRRVPEEIAIVLFRVVQESLTNAIQHGHAKRVVVSIRASQKEVTMKLSDDGMGADWSEVAMRTKDKLGIRVMQEMAASAGGVLSIDSGQKRGTTVRLSLPLCRSPAAHG